MALQSQKTSNPVIGFLNSASERAFKQSVDAFHKGLNESGYEEGRNVEIEYRWAYGRYDRLDKLAAELVSRPVNVIAASGGATPAIAARKATSTIPIIFVCGFNPADPKLRLVADVKKPGGNATGVNVFNTELLPQRREFLSQLVPTREIVLLLNPDVFVAQTGIEQGQVPGTRVLNASTEDDLEQRFAEAKQEAFAILLDADSFFTSKRDLIIELAKEYGVPTSYPWREYVEVGGLISYGLNLTNPYRQIGIYTGMVLKGANPAELPVLQPTAFELVINLGTAKALGLGVPPILLARADKVIW
jgi:putative ABC transport system substrate-binding protein